MDISKLTHQENSLKTLGLLVERDLDGNIRANVPHVRHHSTSGYECGYAGSGPADLALSVMHALIPPLSEEEEQAQYKLEGKAFENAIADPARWSEKIGPDSTRVSTLAYRLHQAFKFDFIAKMDEAGGYIPIADILAWIERQKTDLAQSA